MAAVTVPLVLIVEGVIGVGKSTFLTSFCDVLTRAGRKVRVVPEMVEEWKASGILEKFYTDQARWAYHFQTLAFTDLVRAVRSSWEDAVRDGIDILLVERSPCSNEIFASVLHDDGFLSEMEWRHYLSWAAEWRKLFPVIPSLFLYLTAPIEFCMERVSARGRPGEEKIRRDYEEKLHVEHQRVFSSGKVFFGEAEVDVMEVNTAEVDIRKPEGIAAVNTRAEQFLLSVGKPTLSARFGTLTSSPESEEKSS